MEKGGDIPAFFYLIMMKIFLLFAFLFLSCDFTKNNEKYLMTSTSLNISRDDFYEFYQNYIHTFFINDNPLTMKKSFHDYLKMNVLADISEKNGDTSSMFFKNKYKQAQYNIAIGILKKELFESELQINDDELKLFYSWSKKKAKVRFLCFQDSLEAAAVEMKPLVFDSLFQYYNGNDNWKISAGETDYFSFGDMEPFFEDAVRELKIHEISPLTPCRDGYFYICLQDVEIEPLGTESDFLAKRDDLIIKGRLYHLQKSFVRKTDSLLKTINVEINPAGLENINLYFFHKNENISENEILYEFHDTVFTIGDFFEQLKITYPEDRSWVKDSAGLKKMIHSFAFREYLWKEAVKKGITARKGYKGELKLRKMRILNQILWEKEIKKDTAYNHLTDNGEYHPSYDTLYEVKALVFPVKMSALKIQNELKSNPDLFFDYIKKVKTDVFPVEQLSEENAALLEIEKFPLVHHRGNFLILKKETKIKPGKRKEENIERINKHLEDLVSNWIKENQPVFYDTLLKWK